MKRITYDFGLRTREIIMRVRRMLKAGHSVEHMAKVLDKSVDRIKRYIWLAKQKGTGFAGNPGGTKR